MGRGSFVRLAQLSGEGLDLVHAHGEFLGRGVRECTIFVLEIGVVFLEYSAQCAGSGCHGLL